MKVALELMILGPAGRIISHHLPSFLIKENWHYIIVLLWIRLLGDPCQELIEYDDAGVLFFKNKKNFYYFFYEWNLFVFKRLANLKKSATLGQKSYNPELDLSI